jgi:alpha/beta superfamily hydrolase
VGHNESFDFQGPAGRLEAVLMRPDGPLVAAAVICHAHPLQGGVMHFKVLFRAAKAVQAQSVAALRFNFRGVGRSEGTHDHGRGEQDDVRAALDEAERRFPGLPLLLGGFSFGSSMALHVGVADARVRALFALGVPLDMMDGLSFLDGYRAPRLFVQGAQDRFGPGPRLLELVSRLPEPRTAVVIPESDHFFTGHLDELQATIETWIATRPWVAA